MFERLLALLKKEILQTFRNPQMVGLLVIAPILQLMVFSYAIANDISHISTAIVDQDRSPRSRELITCLTSSSHFSITEFVSSPEEVKNILDQGRAQLVIQINPGFQQELEAGKKVQVQALLDGTDSNTCNIVLNYLSRVFQEFNENIAITNTVQKKVPEKAFKLHEVAWFNENLDAILYFVPAVIAQLITVLSVQLTAMAIVREREMGTIEQIMVTPITPAELVIGKTLPFALICSVELILMTSLGMYWFQIPMRGAYPLLFLATGIYLLVSLGLGLLISAMSSTQQQAMTTMFFFFPPAILLSGMVFPIESMPEWIQWFTYLNPLRYFMSLLRSIFLKGSDLSILSRQLIPLAIYGCTVFFLSARRFKKTVS